MVVFRKKCSTCPLFNSSTLRISYCTLASKRIKADLVIRNIGQLVTIAGHSERPCVQPTKSSLGIMGSSPGPYACVAAKGNTICFIGMHSELSDFVDTSAATELDARGRLVVPGFVDPHTHAIFAGSRETEMIDKLSGLSYLEILQKGGGILKTVRDTRNATNLQIKEQTRERLARMLTCGTTTVEIKTGYGLDLKSEIRLLQIVDELGKTEDQDIVSTLLSAHAIPPEFSGQVDKYIEQVVKPTIDYASESGLAEFCDVFMEEGVFGREQSRAILQYARAKNLGIKMHADEFSDLGGASLAAELRAISADHLMKASIDGIKALFQAGVIPVLLPGTSLSSFVACYAKARDFIANRCPIALASDLSPNSWIESMQFIMSLSCYSMQMTPAEALVASTINGAHAVGRACEVGSIEVGKKCDILIMELIRYEEMPYRIASNNVATVIKNGRVAKMLRAESSSLSL